MGYGDFIKVWKKTLFKKVSKGESPADAYNHFAGDSITYRLFAIAI